MKTLVRICLIVALAFAVSGCGLVQMVLTGHPQPYPPQAPGETSAPPTAQPSLGAGPKDCIHEVWALVPSSTQPATADILHQTITTEQNRLAAMGTPAGVSAEGPDHFTLTFPDWADSAKVDDLVSHGGWLEFLEIPPDVAQFVVPGRGLPDDTPFTPIFDGDQVATARVGSDATGLPVVDLTLKSRAAALLDAYAAGHQGDSFAIVLDRDVVAVPTINASHFDGQLQITGDFTREQVARLVTLISYGALPLPVSQDQFQPGSCAGIGA